MQHAILFIFAITLLTRGGTTPAFAAGDHGHEGGADITIVVDAVNDLVLEYPADERTTVRVAPAALPGLFSSTSPGFIPGEGDGVDEFELAVPTEIEVELVRTEGPVTYTQNAVTLTQPGDTVVIGEHSCRIDVDSICDGGTNDGTVCTDDLDCTGGGTCTGTCEPTSSQIHDHGEFFLNLLTPDHDTFGEGSLTIRINEGAGSANGYGSSNELTLKVSNGYLPALELDPNDPDAAKSADKCRKAVAKELRSVVGKQHALLGKCLDAIYAAEELGKSGASAVKACDVELPVCSGGSNAGSFCSGDKGCPGGLCDGNTGSLAANLRKLTEKAVAKLDKACDKAAAGSFAPFTESNVRTHLGMASCRTQELVGATYNNAIDEIVEVLGACNESTNVCVAGPNAGSTCADADDCDGEAVEEEVREALPCLEMSQIEEED